MLGQWKTLHGKRHRGDSIHYLIFSVSVAQTICLKGKFVTKTRIKFMRYRAVNAEMSSAFVVPNCAKSRNWNLVESVHYIWMLFIPGTFKKIQNNSLKRNNPWSVFGKFWPTEELILKTLKQVIVVESQRHTHFSFLSLDCVDRLFNIPESPHVTTCLFGIFVAFP